MPNTHGVPDFASELQAIMGDVQAPCILSTTFPVVPVSSLTLAAFATHGFVKDGTQLVYVTQAAAPVTLSGANGQFWLALHRNTSSAVASWTRQAGTHYLWRSNPTKPAEPTGGLILSQVTVAGGIITAVSQATVPNTPLSLQDGESVAITGGLLGGTTQIATTGQVNVDGNVFVVDPATDRVGIGVFTPLTTLDVNGDTWLRTKLGIGAVPFSGSTANLDYNKATSQGMYFHQLVSDVGGGNPILFTNVAGTVIGSVSTNATATAYNTSSDARLKEAVEDLLNPLQVIGGLRPISFRWKRNQAIGRGFLANEVQAIVPEAVSGEENAVDAEGNILPQQIDHSKLVPYLVGAVKALIALSVVRGNQIQALAARVAALEAAP